MNSTLIEKTWLALEHPQAMEILDAVGSQGYIAGGYARKVTMDWIGRKQGVVYPTPEPGDIDVFRFKKGEWEDNLVMEKLGYGLRHVTGFTKTYRHEGEGYLKVQLVKGHENDVLCMFGAPGQLLLHFDFTINQFALSKDAAGDYYVTYTDDAINHLLSKEIHIAHTNSPVAMACRIAKYHAMGFSYSILAMATIFDAFAQRPEFATKLREIMAKHDAGETINYTELYEFLRD